MVARRRGRDPTDKVRGLGTPSGILRRALAVGLRRAGHRADRARRREVDRRNNAVERPGTALAVPAGQRGAVCGRRSHQKRPDRSPDRHANPYITTTSVAIISTSARTLRAAFISSPDRRAASSSIDSSPKRCPTVPGREREDTTVHRVPADHHENPSIGTPSGYALGVAGATAAKVVHCVLHDLPADARRCTLGWAGARARHRDSADLSRRGRRHLHRVSHVRPLAGARRWSRA